MAVQKYDFLWEESEEEKIPGQWKIADVYGPLFTAIMHEEKMWKVYDVHNVSFFFLSRSDSHSSSITLI